MKLTKLSLSPLQIATILIVNDVLVIGMILWIMDSETRSISDTLRIIGNSLILVLGVFALIKAGRLPGKQLLAPAIALTATSAVGLTAMLIKTVLPEAIDTVASLGASAALVWIVAAELKLRRAQTIVQSQ